MKNTERKKGFCQVISNLLFIFVASINSFPNPYIIFQWNFDILT